MPGPVVCSLLVDREMVMLVSSNVYSVFGYFQNLNLLALVQDLRNGRTARQA